MGLDPNNPTVQVGITTIACTIPAVASSAYRLWIRRGRIWLDDVLAGCSAIGSIVLAAACFVHIVGRAPQAGLVAAFYIVAVMFCSVIWVARLSILFTIIRMDPCERRRKILWGVAAVFGLLLVVLICQLFWVCEPERGWKLLKTPQCDLRRQIVIAQIVTDIGSDVLISVVPFWLFRSLKNKKLRRRLTWIFGACITTTIVSFVHATFIFTHNPTQEVLAGLVEEAVSVLVCNIPIILTHLVRIQGDEDEETVSGSKSGDLRSAGRDITTNRTTTFGWQRELDTEESGSAIKLTVISSEEAHHVASTSNSEILEDANRGIPLIPATSLNAKCIDP